MVDRREEIIERFVVIVDGITAVKTVARNVTSFDDDSGVELPAAAVLDGDEAAIADEANHRPATVPRRIEMTPLIFVAGAAKPELIGSELNTLRAAIIKAIVTDATLASMVDRYGVRYEGLDTPRHESGRLMLGQRILRFTLTYILDPADL